MSCVIMCVKCKNWSKFELIWVQELGVDNKGKF